MRKTILGLVVCAVFACGYSYASEVNVTFDQNGSLAKIMEQINEKTGNSSDVLAPVEQTKALKEWTVMVFVNAKNNLEKYGLKDVNEMEMIGSTDKINVVAELGRIKGYDSSDGDWTGSKRYLIQKDNNASKVTSPVLMEIAKSDMGDWKYLVGFTKWAMEKFPAKKYMLVVWNHGSGWNKDEKFEAAKGISYDDETGHHLTTPQLLMTLKETGKIDIFSMDACLMQMMEVAYEIKDYTDYVVASEETEPADGYTYNTFLGPLAAKPTMTAAELSKATVDSYTDHYQSISQGATQSSINAKSLANLTALLDNWTSEIMKAGELQVVKDARSKAQDFYYSSNKDLYHFVKLVTETSKNSVVVSKGKEIMSFMKGEVILHNRAYGSGYADAYGLAVYLPSYYSAAYDELKWAQESKWDDFIKWVK
ncbi:MAG: hypothetical protein HY746_00370 [Elusimicrobia bacterium]|nr:hypothetical protein [Elusimicrobiota bacterium]